MLRQVLSKLHGKWQHVLVDEGQDTNLCQFELVNQITGPQAHLCMVGDPDQVCVCLLVWCVRYALP